MLWRLKMKSKEKREKLKEVAPLLWGSYQHMYDVRKTNVDNRTNVLLIIISFLAGVSIMLYTSFKDLLFLIPFLFQVVSFIVLLKVFFINYKQVHWFKSSDKKLLNDLDKEEFYQDLFADLKALEDDTHIYEIKANKIGEYSMYLLIISLYATILRLVFMYSNNIQLYLSVTTLTILLLFVCIYYKKQIKFNYESNYKKFREQIDNWLK